MNHDPSSGDAWNRVLALGVFLAALGVYTATLVPTVPFWDSGEYIATSYILGVPHAPGTPLYVLVGRVFTLVPLGAIAQRVNFRSWISSKASISAVVIGISLSFFVVGFGDLAMSLPSLTGSLAWTRDSRFHDGSGSRLF